MSASSVARKIFYPFYLLILGGMFSACVSSPVQTPQASQPALTTSAPATTWTPSPTFTTTVTRTALPTATRTPTRVPLALCSPLEDVSLTELGQPDLLKNSFQLPRLGFDEGHQGVDFAYWSRGSHDTMLGLPVHSVLEGRVAGVIKNRQPYGNAIIIETSLKALPESWLPIAPTPAPTVQPDSSLFCPTGATVTYNQNSRSLYLLYAHLNQTPSLTAGQPVTCGQVIGEVGTTGRSVNYHLHLETRVGPADAVFPEMAHYINDATPAEMSNFCTWRVSGLFQMFDPMVLLSLQH